MSMLRDADLTLANWLKSVLPPGTGVRFDAPRADWEKRGAGSGAGAGSAFVSAFLCEVHRDPQDLPRSGWSEARDHDGRLVGRQPAPRYYRLTYLVTAWASAAGGGSNSGGSGDEASRRILEEHELLGLLVDACTNADTIASDHLTGSLAEAGIPCFVRCAQESAGRSLQSLWSGFGIAPHAHLELELVGPVVPRMVTDLAPPAREIVLGARQLSSPPSADDDADAAQGRSASVLPGKPAGTGGGIVRRWERTTIVERGKGGPPLSPPSQSDSSR